MRNKQRPRTHCPACGCDLDGSQFVCGECDNALVPQCEGCNVYHEPAYYIVEQRAGGRFLCGACHRQEIKQPVRVRNLELAEVGRLLIEALEATPAGETLEINVTRPNGGSPEFDVYATRDSGATMTLTDAALSLARTLTTTLLDGARRE